MDIKLKKLDNVKIGNLIRKNGIIPKQAGNLQILPHSWKFL